MSLRALVWLCLSLAAGSGGFLLACALYPHPPIPAEAYSRGKAPPLAWEASLERGLERAQGLGKPVLLHLRAPGSPAGGRMDSETFRDEAVRTFAAEIFVPVLVDPSEVDAAAGRYGVSALPSTLALTPDGEVLDAQEGFLGAEAFLDWMDRARRPAEEAPPAP